MQINQIGPKKSITYGKIYNEYNVDEAKAREAIRTAMSNQWDDTFVNHFGKNGMLKADNDTQNKNYFTKELNFKTLIIKNLKTNFKNQFLSKLPNN